jgi:hypothetical protein
MGWTFGYGQRRAELIAERAATQEWEAKDGAKVRDEVLAHCFRGGAFSGTFYAVHERTATPKGGGKPERERWLEVTLMKCQNEPGYGPSWGYKDMEEHMGPGEVSCPLGYLAMVPEPTCAPDCKGCAQNSCGNKWARDWRAEKAERRAKAAAFKVGDTVRLKEGCTPPEVVVVSVRPLRGEYGGRVYNVKPRHLV